MSEVKALTVIKSGAAYQVTPDKVTKLPFALPIMKLNGCMLHAKANILYLDNTPFFDCIDTVVQAERISDILVLVIAEDNNRKRTASLIDVKNLKLLTSCLYVGYGRDTVFTTNNAVVIQGSEGFSTLSYNKASIYVGDNSTAGLCGYVVGKGHGLYKVKSFHDKDPSWEFKTNVENATYFMLTPKVVLQIFSSWINAINIDGSCKPITKYIGSMIIKTPLIRDNTVRFYLKTLRYVSAYLEFTVDDGSYTFRNSIGDTIYPNLGPVRLCSPGPEYYVFIDAVSKKQVMKSSVILTTNLQYSDIYY